MLSLIPISDANPTRRFPIVTVALIVLNALSFLAEPEFGGGIEGSVYFFDNAPIPCQLSESCPAGIDLGPRGVRIPERGPVEFLIAVVISTFLHAGFLHIIGNMLFLWVFGNNIEDYLGRVRFLIFYLVGGIAASFAHILTHASSVLPTVGASGAVAAVMGAYLVLYPKARVNVLVPIFFFFSVIQMSAIAVLGLWFVYQFFIGLQEASGNTAVAWMAHVGGFAYGVVIIYLLGGRPQRPQMVWRPEWRY